MLRAVRLLEPLHVPALIGATSASMPGHFAPELALRQAARPMPFMQRHHPRRRCSVSCTSNNNSQGART